MKTLTPKKRKNNKGFTLVELIIVIAIIAVLAAVLAPQYIKYLDKSRQAMDINALNEIAYAAEVESITVGDGSVEVKIDANGGFTYTSSTLADAVDDIVPAGSYNFSSVYFKKAANYTCAVSNGQATWTPALPIS